MKVTNRADHPVDAILSYGGVPLVAKPPGGDGFSIERSYYSLSGEAVPSDGIAQGERIVVVLKVKQANAWPARILIADLLPAGFEIDNPALVASADLANFCWLPEISNYAHLEFRDDRFVASFTRDTGDNADITLAYVVRAVTPGNFILPPAMVEDMYRPYSMPARRQAISRWSARGSRRHLSHASGRGECVGSAQLLASRARARRAGGPSHRLHCRSRRA